MAIASMETAQGPEILLVEDSEERARPLAAALAERGLRVRWSQDALAAYALLIEEPHDAAIIDADLPRVSGLMLLRLLRGSSRASGMPVIMLSDDRGKGRKLEAFRAGTDDFLARPFPCWELAARLEGLLKRAGRRAPEERALEAHGIRLSMARRQATAHGRRVALTRLEFHLLASLLRRPGAVLDRSALAGSVPGRARELTPGALYAHIRNLRRKLGRSGRAIESLYGAGYRLSGEGAAAPSS